METYTTATTPPDDLRGQRQTKDRSKEFDRPRQGRDKAEHKQEFLEILAEGLPPMIARKDVERFLGGIVTRKTLANADARGEGPKIAYAVGRNVVYRRESLVEYVGDNFTVQRLENLKTL